MISESSLDTHRYLNALISEIDIDEDFKEKIRVTIEGKNYSALNNQLDKLEPCKAVTAIRSLPVALWR